MENKNSVWTLDLCLPTGDYEYGFLVDNKWSIDKKLPHNSKNNLVSVFPFRDVKKFMESIVEATQNISSMGTQDQLVAGIIGMETRISNIEKKLDSLLALVLPPTADTKMSSHNQAKVSSQIIRVSTFRTSTCVKTFPLFEKQLEQKLQDLIEASIDKKKTWFGGAFGRPKAPILVVENKSSIDSIARDSSLILCCGYTASSRLDSGTILPMKEALEKVGPKVICAIFRYGPEAATASIKDAQDRNLSGCVCFSFESKGWIDTPISGEGVNSVWGEISNLV